ncbi:hypothetical protein PTKIN_Ptkin16aG0102400 [Pterospermum kingtungense]
MDPSFGQKNTPISSSLGQQQHTAGFTSLGEMNPLTSSSLELQHYNLEDFTILGELDSLTSSLLDQQHYNPEEIINLGELNSLTSSSLGQQQNPTGFSNFGAMNSHSLIIPNPMGKQDNAAVFINVPGGQLLQYTNSTLVENQTTGHKTDQDSGSGLDLPLPNVLETDTPIAGPNLVKSKAAIYSKAFREKKNKNAEEMEAELVRLRKHIEVQSRKGVEMEGMKVEMERHEEVMRDFSVQMREDMKVEMERLRKEKEEIMRNFSVQMQEDTKVEMERLRKEKEEIMRDFFVQMQEDMKVEMERLRKESEEIMRNFSVQMREDMKVEMERLRKENEDIMMNFSVQMLEDMKVEMERLRKENQELRKNLFVQKRNKEMEVEPDRLRKDIEVQRRKGVEMEGMEVVMDRLCKEKEEVRRNFSYPKRKKLNWQEEVSFAVEKLQRFLEEMDEMKKESLQNLGNIKTKMLLEENKELCSNSVNNQFDRIPKAHKRRICRIKLDNMTHLQEENTRLKADIDLLMQQVNAGAEGRENWIKIPILDR